MQIKLILLLVTAFGCCNADRILSLFIHPGASHFYSFYAVLDKLAEKGHDVVSLSYFKVKDPHPRYKELIITDAPVFNASLSFEMFSSPNRNIWTTITEFLMLSYFGESACRVALNSPFIEEIFQMHKENPFDVVLVELFDTDCALGIVHLLNIPHIGVSSCAIIPWYLERSNIPDYPSYHPSAFLGYSHNMNLFQRLDNYVNVKLLKYLYRFVQKNDNQIVRERFGDNIPDVNDIGNNVSLIFVNQHYSLSGSKPLSHQVIEIGGAFIKEAKPLPEKLQKLIDNAKDGVVFISWGGNINASSLPRDKVNEMLKAFARLPQQFIWKWEDDSLDTIKPKNVFTIKWAPQRDILNHTNVKVFWSHGGNLGTNEGAHSGVPIIVTPVYGDQFLNARAVVERNSGYELLFHDITEENVYKTIKNALQPEIYKNAQRLAYEYQHRPISHLDLAVWWTEHVVATKGAPLLALKTYEMSSFAYYSLDVIFILLSIFATIIALTVLVLRHFIQKKRQNKTGKSKTN